MRKWYQAIRGRMEVKTKATADQIKALTQMSSVFDELSKSVPVPVSVETC